MEAGRAPKYGEKLSKTDFKIGVACPFKLLYRKQGLVRATAENPMLEFLADGGFMVEALAHAVLSQDPDCEIEVSIEHGQFQARIDALIDKGEDGLQIIEIKSSGVDGVSKDQFVTSKHEYRRDRIDELYDVAFQVMVARAAFPNRPVQAFLCCVDKAKTSSDANIFENVEFVTRSSEDELWTPKAVYRGDPERVRSDHLLAFIDVTDFVDDLLPEVERKAKHLLDFIDDGHTRETPLISKSLCRDCEFRGAPNGDRGFSACWGVDGSEPMIIDIYGNPNLKLRERIEVLSERGQVGLQYLEDKDVEGTGKTDLIRQRQLAALRNRSEVFDSDAAQALKSVEYPLAFFDIETSRVPLPYAPGMSPYQQSVFQFSVHILRTPDATALEHYEWLDLENRYPNAPFLEKLRPVLGDRGTVMMWSSHEQNALRDVKEQLSDLGQLTGSTATWIDELAGVKSDEGKGKRLFDLSKISQSAYAHPSMNGSHSIKKVLDAVWSENRNLWEHPWFEKYFEPNESGIAIDPYKVLTSHKRQEIRDGFVEIDVNNGVAAMRAYQSLMFGPHRNDVAYSDGLRNSLLAYCELDTAAMVMIWTHFMHLLS